MTEKPIPRTSLEPVCETLAGVLHKHRRERELSLSELAKQSLVSRQAISYVENQQRVPTVNTVARLCRAFGVPVSRVVAAAERRLRRRQGASAAL